MIHARTFQREHTDGALPAWEESDFLASEALMLEMKRVYQIEGAREIIEQAQREALFRLDAFLKK